MTLIEVSNKIKKLIEEIENDDFNISLISEISCYNNEVGGKCVVSHNEEYLKSEIIANYEEEKK